MNKLDEYLKLTINSDFPYKTFSLEQLKKYYNNLKKVQGTKYGKTGQEIIEHYHRSVWRCNIKNHKSPIDAWEDLNIIKQVIKNRLKYLETSDLTIFNIRAGLTISGLAPKVSLFRPATAKYLIEKYLNEFDTIFDPCSGFSGRLLGTCCLNKRYIGQDINSISVKESQAIIKDFGLNADIKIADSLYDTGEYDCLFTCPPYGDKEIWHQDIEILSADEWIDVCLKNYKCKKYLFVVDKTSKYKDFVVEEIKNTSHFGSNSELVVLIKS